MPIITSLGKGQHTNRGGRGLYTKSDAVKGSQPTPSQAERGVDAGDIDARWWLLTQPQKQAWQDVSTFGRSGRQTFSVVNRLRWDGLLAHTYEPPPGPYVPFQPALSGFIGYGPSDDNPGSYVYASIPDGPPDERLEVMLYKPASGPDDPAQSAAHYWFANLGGYSGSAGFQFLGIFGPGGRGPDYHPYFCPSPATGDAVKIRVLPSTVEGYPGLPIYASFVMSAGPPPS